MASEQQVKIYRIFYWILSVSIVLVGITLAITGFLQRDNTQRLHLLDRANTIAQILSQEEILALSASENDISSLNYESLKQALMDARGVNRDVRFIYLLGKKADGQVFFYVDSEPANSADYSPPGQFYDEASFVIKESLRDGLSRSEGPDTDRWGTWFSAYAPILNEEGKVIALLGIDTVATEHLLSNLSYAIVPLLVSFILLITICFLKKIQDREQSFLDTKEEFLSVASHEIRSPLMGIKWALEDIERRGATLDPETSDTLKIIRQNSTRLIEEASDLLKFKSWKKSDSEKIKIEELDPKKLIEEVQESLLLSAREHRVALEARAESLGKINSDRKNLRRVLSNLTSNAIKYTRQDTKVSIVYRQTSEADIFEVIDQGEGMSAEDARKIFEGYYRTKQAIQSGEIGTGFGLKLASRIITALGGKITVDSKLGRGSTFTISLPKK